MNKSSLISAIALLLIIAAFSVGVYFLMRGNTSEDLISQKNLLETKLVVAKDKLNKAKAALDTMTSDLRASFALAVGVQDQMKKSLDVVGQTNFMFNNPEGDSPEFIVENFAASTMINNERRDINILLAGWEKKIDILFIKKIDAKESEKIRKDAQTIWTFIENLSRIVQSLTPENSGLSQMQIDIYIAQLPSADAIDEVLATLTATIENSEHNSNSISQNSTATGPQTNTQTNIAAEENQPPPVFPSFAPIVTPEEVVAQQSVVAHAQSEVAAVQQQLTQVEEQVQQSNPPVVPADTVANSDPVIETTPEAGNQNTNSEIDPDIYFGRPTSRKITPTEGIIIQPGPPRLIQGSDAY